MTGPRFLELRGIVKDFPGVRAVDDVDLTLNKGEILGLIGENGAGKSTLMKVLAGLFPPDHGEILLNGKRLEFHSVAEAESSGIDLIHQELHLVPNLDIAANLFLGREWVAFTHRPSFWSDLLMSFNFSHLDDLASRLLERVQLDLSPDTLIRRLTTGQQQKVTIARALSRSPRLLIMDEPTASLTKEDTRNLFDIIRQLREQEMSIIYVSHRLEEILAISDRVFCLRDGRKVAELETARAEVPELIRMMVGRQITDLYPQRLNPDEKIIFKAEEIKLKPESDPISFQLRRGEILGFAGLIGAGRTALMEAIFGVRPAYSGSVQVNGRSLLPGDPGQSIQAGIAMVPEDRKQYGLVLQLSLRENLTLPFLKRLASRQILSLRQEQALSRKLIQHWQIKASSPEAKVSFLSGGNQQKVVLAKWLERKPDILILDEPTRGIDVSTKHSIYHLIGELAGQGLGIVLVSSEMEELLGLCHRIIVMREGQLSGELSGKEMSEENILALAATDRAKAKVEC